MSLIERLMVYANGAQWREGDLMVEAADALAIKDAEISRLTRSLDARDASYIRMKDMLLKAREDLQMLEATDKTELLRKAILDLNIWVDSK